MPIETKEVPSLRTVSSYRLSVFRYNAPQHISLESHHEEEDGNLDFQGRWVITTTQMDRDVEAIRAWAIATKEGASPSSLSINSDSLQVLELRAGALTWSVEALPPQDACDIRDRLVFWIGKGSHVHNPIPPTPAKTTEKDVSNEPIPTGDNSGILGVREISGEIQLGVYRASGSGVTLQSSSYIRTQHPTTHDVKAIRDWANYAKTSPDAASLRVNPDHPYFLELEVGHRKYQIQMRPPIDAVEGRKRITSWMQQGSSVLVPAEEAPPSKTPQQVQKDVFQDGLLKGRAAVLQQIHAAREAAARDLSAAKETMDVAVEAYQAAADKVAVFDELLSQLDQE
jgi:hypothetical protein